MAGYKRMKVISVVWGLILVLLVIGLTVIGFVYKHESEVYKEYEELLVKQATTILEILDPARTRQDLSRFHRFSHFEAQF